MTKNEILITPEKREELYKIALDICNDPRVKAKMDLDPGKLSYVLEIMCKNNIPLTFDSLKDIVDMVYSEGSTNN